MRLNTYDAFGFCYTTMKEHNAKYLTLRGWCNKVWVFYRIHLSQKLKNLFGISV